jgi:glycosyltransferase involved in cell wall biosynthesis
MIKILFDAFFEHIRYGGVSNYVKLLTDNIDKKKFQIIDLSKGENAKIEKMIEINYSTNLIRYFLILYHIAIFKHSLKKYNPNIVHLNPSLNWASILREFIFLKIAKKQKFPVLLFIHGWRWSFFNKILKSNILKMIFTNYLQRADKILVLSYNFKRALIDLGINDEKIIISSIMIETNQYIPNRKDFNKPFTVLFCSRLIKEKGPFELLEAIPQVIKKYPETKFIFIGDGKCSLDLRNKAKKMSINDNVFFTGSKYNEEKIELFKKSHIFVLPSYSEGFPTVVLEAMAAGLPLIITPVGGLVDTMEDGRQGLIISTKIPDSKEIAEKIIYLIENPYLLKKISENNIREAKEKYDVKIVTEKITEIYSEIVCI